MGSSDKFILWIFLVIILISLSKVGDKIDALSKEIQIIQEKEVILECNP